MLYDEFNRLYESGQIATIERLSRYAFCRDGRVWDFKHGCWTKPYVMNNGKHKWYVTINGGPMLLHRLILEAFRGPCPEGLIGCHNDDDPSNNHFDNLRWDTKQSNVDDRKRRGGYAVGSKHHGAKLTEADIPKIFKMKAMGGTLKTIGAEFGVHFSIISDVLNRKTWKHVEI